MSSSVNGNLQGQLGWTPPTVEELQQFLPQYDIESILGRGGMGAVYRGRQATLQRTVAIKVLPETLIAEDDEFQYAERFKLEARSMANLDHPAIISVYDFGQTSGGHLYFVMEFIDGMDIEQYIAASGGQVDPDHAVAIVSHVLDALDYAHSNGILHRDIKPANVLISREGRVKIADFGLAKEFGGDAAEMSGLTLTNMTMGTPDYIAPESLEFGVVPDHRADLYAVGVMLYRMLTGKLPRGMFKLPSEHNSELDHRFDDIISVAMESDPGGRFQSAVEFRNKLDELQSAPITRIEPHQDSGAAKPAVSGKVFQLAPSNSDSAKPTSQRPPISVASRFRSAIVVGISVAVGIIGGTALYFRSGVSGKSEETPSATLLAERPTAPTLPSAAPPRIEPEAAPEIPEIPLASREPVAVSGANNSSGIRSAEGSAPRLVSTDGPKAESGASPIPPSFPEPTLSPAAVSVANDSEPAAASDRLIPNDPEFLSRLTSYRDYRKKMIGALIVSYRNKLNETKETAISEGNLDAVEQAKAVLKNLNDYTEYLTPMMGQVEIEPLPLPESLEGLLEQHASLDQTFRKALADLEMDAAGKLDQSLQLVEKGLTQGGKIEVALAVRDYRTQTVGRLISEQGTTDVTEVAVAMPEVDKGAVEGNWTALTKEEGLIGWTGRDLENWSVDSGAFYSSNSSPIITPFPHKEFLMEGEIITSDNGNGGVLFFDTKPGSFEFAIIGSKKVFWGDTYTGGIFQMSPGSPLERHSPESNLIKDDTWTPFRIQVKGNRLTTWIDGTEAVEVELTKEYVGETISLQGGRDPESKVGYRNIRIRSLSATE